jgi:hypothetical protein
MTATTVGRVYFATRRCRSHDQCPVRAPLADHLLTPQDAALLFIGYQPAAFDPTEAPPVARHRTA